MDVTLTLTYQQDKAASNYVTNLENLIKTVIFHSQKRSLYPQGPCKQFPDRQTPVALYYGSHGTLLSEEM